VRPRRRSLAAVGLLALALAGCGQQAGKQRVAVAAYLKQVQRNENAFAKPLAAVAKTGSLLAAEQKRGSLLDSLAGAAGESSLQQASLRLAQLRGELAAIPAPPPAARLRLLLLELDDRQIALARELAGLQVFLPRFSAVLKGLAPATRRLQAVLAVPAVSGAYAVAAAYELKAAALRRFAATASSTAKALRAIHPPAVWAPAYKTQLASLEGMSSGATHLAQALQTGQTGSFASLMLTFDGAATISQTAAAQRAQIDAIKAYDRAVQGQNALAEKIALERLRLANKLPQ
jgi:hypothetical protein